MHVHLPLGGPVLPVRRMVQAVLANPLDCRLLELWLAHHFPQVACLTTAKLAEGLDSCRRYHVHLAILDPAVGANSVRSALALLGSGLSWHLLVLDQRPLELRLMELLPYRAASYVSRAAGSEFLAQSIAAIFETGRRVIDPALAAHLDETPCGPQLKPSPRSRLWSRLSTREQQVLYLLVEGKSVQECADSLGLSHSTIDNHKSRLMKKLGVHKTSALILHAYRCGLMMQ